jgi:hypothetical protein
MDVVVTTHQNHTHTETLGGPDRPLDFILGSVIPAHGIDSDGHHIRELEPPGAWSALLFGNFDYFAALVFSAVRANAVRHFRFVAVRALGKTGRL